MMGTKCRVACRRCDSHRTRHISARDLQRFHLLRPSAVRHGRCPARDRVRVQRGRTTARHHGVLQPPHRHLGTQARPRARRHRRPLHDETIRPDPRCALPAAHPGNQRGSLALPRARWPPRVLLFAAQVRVTRRHGRRRDGDGERPRSCRRQDTGGLHGRLRGAIRRQPAGAPVRPHGRSRVPAHADELAPLWLDLDRLNRVSFGYSQDRCPQLAKNTLQ
ncbi:hypothetical protein EDB89DRAFT_1351308 [Lactarius sanguifluus]|nr:hypothetical protein EDB89DRAFT_1351308 [Lactarius sanguifluus]